MTYSAGSSEHRADREAIYLSPAEGFRRLADTYDARMTGNPVPAAESAATLAAIPDLAGAAHVADIGCGTGRYALQLARQGAARVTGVDIAPEMLEAARRKARKAGDTLPVRWEIGDVYEHLPFRDDALDAAVCALLPAFLPDLAPAFREIARVLRPGGALVVSEHHPHGLCAARAASLTAYRKDNAPYLRFTSHQGEECRIVQHPHLLSAYFDAAQQAGMLLEHVAEPVADRRHASYGASGMHQTFGIPLALVMRFRKTSGQ